jgi:hypothetical protein
VEHSQKKKSDLSYFKNKRIIKKQAQGIASSSTFAKALRLGFLKLTFFNKKNSASARASRSRWAYIYLT